MNMSLQPLATAAGTLLFLRQVLEVELLRTCCIVPDDVAFAFKQVLVGLEAFKADRSPCMELARRDADFGAAAIAAAI